MGGGNSHQRAIERAAKSRMAEQVAETVLQRISNNTVPPESKTTWQKLLDFFEHSWVIAAVVTVGTLVGFFYTPVLAVCGFAILLAFHRVGVVRGKRPWVQIVAYLGLFMVTTIALYGADRAVKDHLLPPAPPLSPKSRLSLSIDSIVVSDTVLDLPGASSLIVATITNTGEPTIADTWELTVKTPSGQIYKSSPELIDRPLIVGDLKGHPPTVIQPNAALYRKTAPNPLATGSKTQGILVFKMIGEPSRTSVMAVGNIFTLFCKDVYGNQIKATFTVTGVKDDGLLPYPGILP
jgi:hypothetical protein